MGRPDRREQILAAALAVFAEKGYHAAGVADIIARAGIARGTFYLYFSSKRAIFDDILEGIFRRIMAEIRAVAIPTPWDERQVIAQVRDNATRLARMFLGERDLVRVLLAEATGLDEPARLKLAAFYGRLGAWVAASLEDGIRLGIVRPCRPLVAAHAIIGMLRGLLWAWVTGILPLDERSLVDEVLDMTRAGVLVTTLPARP